MNRVEQKKRHLACTMKRCTSLIACHCCSAQALGPTQVQHCLHHRLGQHSTMSFKSQHAPLKSSKTARAGCLQVVCGLRFFRQNRGPVVPVSKPITPEAVSIASLLANRARHRPAGAAAPTLLDSSVVPAPKPKPPVKYHGVHHVALLVKDLDRSMEFYQGILGLEVNPDRPHHKLPYRGAWLWIGPEMIHLMELDNPDPLTDRPEHGGRDRHFCIGVTDVQPLVEKLEAAGVPFTRSMSGRPAIFFRDPDMNCLEVVEQEPWR